MAALHKITRSFVLHYKTESWGHEILIMEKTGCAFARIYRYHDDSSTVYLDCLSVDEKSRRQGIGTELHMLREKTGMHLGATVSCLWVKKNTWMHEWYRRRGYEDWKDNENEENAIWMKKYLDTEAVSAF